jgi:hypothetical protein
MDGRPAVEERVGRGRETYVGFRLGEAHDRGRRV